MLLKGLEYLLKNKMVGVRGISKSESIEKGEATRAAPWDISTIASASEIITGTPLSHALRASLEPVPPSQQNYLFPPMLLRPFSCQFLSLGNLVGRHKFFHSFPIFISPLIFIRTGYIEPFVGLNKILVSDLSLRI